MWLGLLGLVFSIVVALFVDRAETERADAAFLQMSDRLVQATQSRLSNYAVSLRYAHAFSGVNRNNTIEFSRYIQFLNLPAALPGALSIGLIRKVSAEDWDKYYAQSRQHLPITQFKVQSLTDAFIVEALEPGILKTEILGYDFAQDPELAKRLTAVMAHEKELIIRSASIGAQHHADFFVFVPWYSLNSRGNNISSKGGTVLGFFYMPIDAEKMMASINSEYSNFLNFSIYFGNGTKEENKIFSLDKNNKQSLDTASLGREFLINYAGANFTFMIKSGHDFDRIYKKNDYAWCLLFGMLISASLTICYGLLKKHKNIKDEFNFFSQSKQNNNDKYECVIDAVGDVIFTIDYSGKILKVNNQAEMVFQYNESDVVGKNLAPFLLDLSLSELNKHIEHCINMQGSKSDSTLIKVQCKNNQGVGFFAWLHLYDLKIDKTLLCVLSKPSHSWFADTEAIQERLQLAVDSAGLGIWEWQLAENKIFWDKVMYALYALDPTRFEISYASWSALIINDDFAQFDGAIHAMLQDGDPLHETVRIRRADGEVRYISMHGKLIINEEDQSERVIGVNFDITPLKAAEALLRESGERFSLAAQAAQEGIWDWNMQTGEVWFSPQWKANFGYQDDELANNLTTWDQLIDSEDRKSFLRLTQEYNDGTVARFELTLRFKHKDGHWVSVRSRAVHLKNAQGEVVRMVGSHEDITEILKHEAALDDSRKRMDLTIQCAGLGVWDWDITSDEVLFGGKWAEMLGYDESEIKPHIESWALLVHPDDFAAANKILQAHFDGIVPVYSAEFRMLEKSGSWRWILGVGRVNAFNDDGKPLRILGVNIDIHERKMNEAALQEATAMAEAANRAKSEFLANMSHEIRTPLNAVLGFSSLMRTGNLEPQQRDFVDSIHTAGNALLYLINDLLDFSKIEAGKLELENIQFDFRQVCEEAFEMIAQKANEKRLDIASIVVPSLPECLIGDPGRIRQVLLNLLNNAIKFTEQGQVLMRVYSEAVVDHKVNIRLEVEDSGVGISDKVKKVLFSSFTQADASTTRKFGGTGLGLSICKKLIEAMGGRIGVDSVEGKGALFWFELQLATGNVPVPININYSDRSNKVLVIDAFAAHAEALWILLGRLGLVADCYNDVQRGLAALNADDANFMLAIVDNRFESMSFTQIVDVIRSNKKWANLPIIILSDWSCSDNTYLKEHADFYLAKPVQERALRLCIDAALNLPKKVVPLQQDLSLSIESISDLKLYILVAEDNPINQKVAVLMLQNLGCRVDVAANGLEALNAVQKGNYDLVFMDCQMPEMDGYTAVAHIRSLVGPQSKVPIVALTANAFKSDQDRCFAIGMNDFIAKPISVEHLIRVLSIFFPNQQTGPAVLAQSRGSMSLPIEATDVENEVASIYQTFEDLKKMLGMDMTDELIQLFLPTLDECLANLGPVIESGSGDAVVTCAHKLKGAAAQMGAQSLADLCKKVEQTGRDKKLEEAWPFHAKIVALGSAVGQRLRDK
jgi:PAS domain S-box-containing protein